MKSAAYLAFLVVIGFVFVMLINASVEDWRACLRDAPAKPLTWRAFLPRNVESAWIHWLPSLPLCLLAFGRKAPDRRTWLAAIALLGLGSWLMWPGSNQHDCDRKGPDVDFWLFVLVPVTFAMTIVVLAERSIANRPE